MIEMWKDIPNYEGLYQVSNLGIVKSLIGNRGNKREKILKPYYDQDKYLYVTLSKNKSRKKHKVHRLVAKAFIPNLEEKPCIDHINRNKGDNSTANLRWVTPKENSNNINTINHLKEVGKVYKTSYGRPINNKNGGLFISIIEASRQMGIPRSNIQYHLKNKTGVWEYV